MASKTFCQTTVSIFTNDADRGEDKLVDGLMVDAYIWAQLESGSTLVPSEQMT